MGRRRSFAYTIDIFRGIKVGKPSLFNQSDNVNGVAVEINDSSYLYDLSPIEVHVSRSLQKDNLKLLCFDNAVLLRRVYPGHWGENLVASGQALPHHIYPETGWVS